MLSRARRESLMNRRLKKANRFNTELCITRFAVLNAEVGIINVIPVNHLLGIIFAVTVDLISKVRKLTLKKLLPRCGKYPLARWIEPG